MEFTNEQKQELFDLYMSDKKSGYNRLKDFVSESPEFKTPIAIKRKTDQLQEEIIQTFANDSSYIKDYIESNHSSKKVEEGAILLVEDGQASLQPSINDLQTQSLKIEAMAEILGDSFKESFSESTDAMLSRVLVDLGQAKRTKDTGVEELAKKIKKFFRVDKRPITNEDISMMLFQSKNIPERTDISLSAMGKGKTFQKNKAEVLSFLRSSPPQYKSALVPFIQRLEDTVGMDEKKQIFKFSTGSIIADKNLKFAQDRKEIYQYWKSVNDRYDNFTKALDDVIALDFDSLKSLNSFKGAELNYIYEVSVYDAPAIKFPDRIKRVLDGLDKVVEELEDYRRVDEKMFETEVGYMGDTRTAQEAAGMGCLRRREICCSINLSCLKKKSMSSEESLREQLGLYMIWTLMSRLLIGWTNWKRPLLKCRMSHYTYQ